MIQSGLGSRPLIVSGILTFFPFCTPVRHTAPKRLPLWERMPECSHCTCLASVHSWVHFLGSRSSGFQEDPQHRKPSFREDLFSVAREQRRQATISNTPCNTKYGQPAD